MKLPKWARPIEWLQSISSVPSFEKIMLVNILKDEVISQKFINQINPYFENLQKISSEKHFLLNILVSLLMEVDIYISQGGRKNIKSARYKLKNAAKLAEQLADELRDIKNYENDSLTFVFPESLEKLLQRQGFYASEIEKTGDDFLDTKILLNNMAANLRNTQVGTPTLEWIDDHNTQTDFCNVVTRALERHIVPPINIIGAFIYLCFGVEIDEENIRKFNSPLRKKKYKPDIQHIKIN